jgi:hypothetical protein
LLYHRFCCVFLTLKYIVFNMESIPMRNRTYSWKSLSKKQKTRLVEQIISKRTTPTLASKKFGLYAKSIRVMVYRYKY